MRADYLVHYDQAGRPNLVVTSPDAPFVVSAYLEYGSHASWHFGYTRKQQQHIAELITSADALRRALLYAWFGAVDPNTEGGTPVRHLDVIITGRTGWAIFHTGERVDRYPMRLLTVERHNPSSSLVRLGEREIYTDRPFVEADRIRAAGAEYLKTGRVPESVSWQRRANLVPQGPFARRLVAEEDLPPQLDWSYPKRAQPWAFDPPPLPVS